MTLSEPLTRAFFDRPVLEVALALLGQVVRHRGTEDPVALRLTEVEAYAGAGDPGSHAYRGQTARNAVMFGESGHAYVYFTYGMHFCLNLVCGPPGVGEAVLLRAGEVVEGRELARTRRWARARRPGSDRDLARGPARLTQALGIDRRHNGLDLCDPTGPLRILSGQPPAAAEIRHGPRTGVAAGAALPWRFWVAADRTVSPYRAHVPRRRSVAAGIGERDRREG